MLMVFFIIAVVIGVIIYQQKKKESEIRQYQTMHSAPERQRYNNSHIAPSASAASMNRVETTRTHIYNRQSAQIAAENSLRIANDCKNLVNTTKNPDVFFQRYDLLLDEIRILNICSQYISFSGDQPSAMLERITSIRQEETGKFITRYWMATCEKADSLKTESGKKNTYRKFYENCEKHKNQMNASNIKLYTDMYNDAQAESHVKTAPSTASSVVFYEDNSFDKGAYDAENNKRIAAFESKYDLTTVEGILNIPVSKQKQTAEPFSVVSTPEQILQKKATAYKKENKMDLAIACLRKSNQFMRVSWYSYQVKDYMRLVEFLYMNAQFEEARAERQNVYRFCGFNEAEFYQNLKESDYRDDAEKAEYYSKVLKPGKEEFEDRENYYWILEYLPESAPKSFGGYRRMKKSNSANFVKLKQLAAENGREI